MRTKILLCAAAALLCALSAAATSFVVPSDEELLAKSGAVVVGSVEGSYVDDSTGDLQTVYEIRVSRALKGDLSPRALVEVRTPGGFIPGVGGVLVVGSPRMNRGERVLLFLSRDDSGWIVTDMTLGKFRFAKSRAGERLLVRDMEDVLGWDRNGREHRERVRREDAFLQFIETEGRQGGGDYLVDAASVTLESTAVDQRFAMESNAAPFAAATYTDWVSNQPTRWASSSATFYKRSGYNISGASDGGVSVIQNGLAAWNNACASIVLSYGGERATPSANYDGINIVEFNDPQQRVPGSWTGSGTIAITFLSFSGTHSFAGQTWWNVMDADVVFQEGFTATHPAFPTAMTHELGHAIGFRHSNEHYNGGGTCDPSVEECTSAAIMNSMSVASYGYTLQPWDLNAVSSVYPDPNCTATACTPPTITSQPQSRTITSGGSVVLSVAAAGTGLLHYQWYVGTSGTRTSPFGPDEAAISVNPAVTTSYWVQVANACGSSTSAAAVVTVSPPAGSAGAAGDFTGDGRADILWRNYTTGQNVVWAMSGTTYLAGLTIYPPADPAWRMSGSGDFNADGSPDIVWRNPSTGQNLVWFMGRGNPPVYLSTSSLPSVSGTAWAISGVADFNRDGKPDLLWRNSATGQVVIWLMNGTNLASSIVIATVADPWRIEGAADMTADGNVDILWRNYATGENLVWQMNGTSYVAPLVLPSVPDLNWNLEAMADYNGDANTDLVWRNYATGENRMWLMARTSLTSSVAIVGVGDLSWQIAGPR